MLIKDFLVVTVVFVCFLCIGKHLNTLKTRKNALYCHHKVKCQMFFSLCTWINVVRVILTVSFDQTDNFRIMVLYFLLYGLLTCCFNENKTAWFIKFSDTTIVKTKR